MSKKKKNIKISMLSVFLGGWICLGAMAESAAGVNVNVATPDFSLSIGAPPPVVIQSPPPMAVIPGTYVYMAPDVGVDILFYHGHWYRQHQGHWFSAHSYNGPWVHVAPAMVPRPILNLPPGYHRMPPGHNRIPYEHVRGNWERWEREKHWHHSKEWQRGSRGGHEEAGKGHERHEGHGRRD